MQKFVTLGPFVVRAKGIIAAAAAEGQVVVLMLRDRAPDGRGITGAGSTAT